MLRNFLVCQAGHQCLNTADKSDKCREVQRRAKMCKAIVTGADQTREQFRDFTYIIYQLPAELGTPVSIKAWHSPRHAASATASNKACCYHLLHLPRRFQVLSSSKCHVLQISTVSLHIFMLKFVLGVCVRTSANPSDP